jgi:hypothetical protein
VADSANKKARISGLFCLLVRVAMFRKRGIGGGGGNQTFGCRPGVVRVVPFFKDISWHQVGTKALGLGGSIL